MTSDSKSTSGTTDNKSIFSFSRRSVLQSGALVGSGAFGLGFSKHTAQPALATSNDWSASDVQGVDPIEAVLVGGGSIDLQWSNFVDDAHYIEWELEARLTSQGEQEGSDEFHVVANNEDRSRYTISEEDTPEGSDENIEFFNISNTGADSTNQFDVHSDNFSEYEDTNMVNIINEHPNILAEDFMLDDGGDLEETDVELRLTIKSRRDLSDDIISTEEHTDTFTVTVDEGGETSTSGDAGTDVS